MSVTAERSIKVADEVWIATALLHKENPGRADFTVQEIVDRARREAIYGNLRPGIRVHALQQCVANRPPNPGRYRMLFATGKHTRRLFRQDDLCDPSRRNSKTVPFKDEIPEEYRFLLDWYQSEYMKRAGDATTQDPILGLRGLGKEIWADEDPDGYVRRLRESW